MNARAISLVLWVINLTSIAACTTSYVYLAYYVYLKTASVMPSNLVLVSPMVVPVILYVAIKRVVSSATPKAIFATTNLLLIGAALLTFFLIRSWPMIAIAGGLVIGLLDAIQRVTRTVAIKNYLKDDDVRYAVPLTLTAQFIAGGIAGLLLSFLKERATPEVMLFLVTSLFIVAMLASCLLPSRDVATSNGEEIRVTSPQALGSVRELMRQFPLLKRYLLSSIVFCSVFQGFYNVSRVALPADRLHLSEKFVGEVQMIGSIAALCGAVFFYVYNRSGKVFSNRLVRQVCVGSLALMCGAVVGVNVPASFSMYFFYMFLWEVVFFNYEADVVRTCPKEKMPLVSAYQYAASYLGIMSVTGVGTLVTRYVGLPEAALMLSVFYLIVLWFEYRFDEKLSQGASLHAA